MALDGQPAPSVTGSKPMVIRYQKDTSTVPANLGVAGGKSMSRWGSRLCVRRGPCDGEACGLHV